MKPERQYLGDYIQGNFVKVTDPNGEILSRNPGNLALPALSIPFSYEQAREAVAAAKRSFGSWKRMSMENRANHLKRFRDLISSRSELLAWHISYEIGKPVWESHTELQEGLDLIDHVLVEAKQTAIPRSFPDADAGCTGTVRFHPRGVAVILPPLIRPVTGTLSHLIPTLLYGNTAVVKFAKWTPLVAQCLASLAHEAGIPSGVFNVVHGDGELARRLTMDSDVNLILFTGSE